MTESRESLLQHYRQMRAELLTAIGGLSDEQLSDPALDGWSVKDHLGHIALWDDLRAGEVVRISAGHESAWRMTDQQGDTYNALTYDLRRDLTPAQVRWELAHSQLRLLEAIAAATERGLDPALYGEASLRSTHEAQHTVWITRWRATQGS